MANNSKDTILTGIFGFGIDIKKRRVFLQYGMGSESSNEENIATHVIRGLLHLDSTDGDIELWIHTPGGDVDDMFAIYDVMQLCENNITTIGHGAICSAGALILAGGTTRQATEHSTFMVHEFQYGMSDGGTREQKIQLRMKEKQETIWAELMGKATEGKKTKKFWLDKIKKEPEYWLDAAGMLSHGIIDEIL